MTLAPIERARQSVERLRAIATGRERVDAPSLRIDEGIALELFESQLACRLLDVEAHVLRGLNEGHYTIASAGHEGNVVLGRLTRPSDPALLHYRSGALVVERARQVPSTDAIYDILLSLVASAEDPIAGGRHKVFGSAILGIPPQTSTIASHLPKAVGMAVALERAARLGVARAPEDAIVVASFGDASVNHSTAQGAFNAAAWAAFQRLPVPLLLVCEDNGLGVSVRTPTGWIEARMRATPALCYIAADGSDLSDAYAAAERAVTACRRTRAPVFLHLRCERLWGHAGSDLDTEYRTSSEIADAEARDPLARSAQTLLDSRVLSAASFAAMLERLERAVRERSERARRTPKLATREAVMASIAPGRPDAVAAEARRAGYAPMPADAAQPKPLGHCIRAGLADLMRKYPELIVFGEDVAQKGGVYGVTVGLWKTFGPKRVFNTLLDEQTILGLALGAGQVGLLPMPEIQFLAYLHNAEDQLRGEAATLSFFSSGQLKNPCVVRIAGLGYQKGFGGHFHNDDSLAVLRDLPGIVVAVPSRGDDAVRMLRTCVAAAKIDGRVCVFIEPIALYHTRDLEPGDGAWTFPLPPQDHAIDIGDVGVYAPESRDLAIVTYGNGVPMSLRAQRRLESNGVRARVVDLRWIAPLPETAIVEHALDTGAVLVVDECRRSGNISEAVAACLFDHADARRVAFARVTSADSFVPIGKAADLVLVQEDEIVAAALRLRDVGGRSTA